MTNEIQASAAFIGGLFVCLAIISISSCLTNRELVLVNKGQDPIPIAVAGDAGEVTRQAAEDLAVYIEKISGTRPDVLTAPADAPERAIWVGIQPGISENYPGLDLEFSYPEEILIACNGKQLVIAGRDRFAGEKQMEFGTANAVYTFLQDYLDVRWLWPGPLGEDIIQQETIKMEPFEFRYHPQIRQRDVLMRLLHPATPQWAKFQRIYFDSFWMYGQHSLVHWWDKYHRDHPDYFALQPDGTRSGYPSPDRVKLCQSNPAVWEQWLDQAEKELGKDPSLLTVSAAPNDTHSSGICVCRDCRAWDNPEGTPWTYYYEGGERVEHVAMTDRYITFWNTLARGLKERFPEREVYVSAFAYGPGTPVPTKKVEDNVVIGYVGKFPLVYEIGPPDRNPKQGRQEQKEEFRQWSEKAPMLMFRPNLWYWGGGLWGLPELSLQKTMEDMRFVAEHGSMGIYVDGQTGHWANIGPMYYLLAQMAWDPFLDGNQLMEDYYSRGFGKAAATIGQYWDLLEEANGQLVRHPDYSPFGIGSPELVEIIQDVYTSDLLERAHKLLEQAANEVSGEPAKYAERVAFLKTGLEYTDLMLQVINTMSVVRESRGKDRAAVEKAIGLWEDIDKLLRDNPLAVKLSPDPQNRWRVKVIDYLGPPSAELKGAAGLVK
jgi:hypothetical protein